MSPIVSCALAFICTMLTAAEYEIPKLASMNSSRSYSITVFGTKWTGVQCSQEASCVTFVSDVSISSHVSTGDGVPGCSSPSSIPNAKVSAPSRQEGDIASYTCNINYGFCRKVDNTRTCLKSGDWSTLDPSAVCHQIYWDKLPAVPLRRRFPCPAHRGTIITVKGVPTRASNTPQGDNFRMQFTLIYAQSGTSTTVSVRSLQHVIQITANVRGRLGRPNRNKRLFPFKVTKPFKMLFKLMPTKFSVMVDSKIVAVHPFETRDPGVVHMVITYDVRVGSISIKYPDQHCQMC